MRKVLFLSCVALSAAGAFADTVFVREKAGRIWQDGLFSGDGRTGRSGLGGRKDNKRKKGKHTIPFEAQAQKHISVTPFYWSKHFIKAA